MDELHSTSNKYIIKRTASHMGGSSYRGSFSVRFYIYQFELIHPYQDGNGRVDWLMYNIDMIIFSHTAT